MPEQIYEFIRQLEVVVGHTLKDVRLLEVALTHRSFVNEAGNEDLQDNERLEFLGDAVLGMIITDLLMHRYPQEQEGVLSKYRSAIVNEKSLAAAGRAAQLGEYIRFGKGEEMTQGREKDSILANTFEAVVAGLYLSGGLLDAEAFVQRFLYSNIEKVPVTLERHDYKTALQELTQQRLRTIPKYVLVHEGGPDHDKVFESQVMILRKVYGSGKAKSKKDSEQICAQEALEALRAELEISD